MVFHNSVVYFDIFWPKRNNLGFFEHSKIMEILKQKILIDKLLFIFFRQGAYGRTKDKAVQQIVLKLSRFD